MFRVADLTGGFMSLQGIGGGQPLSAPMAAMIGIFGPGGQNQSCGCGNQGGDPFGMGQMGQMGGVDPRLSGVAGPMQMMNQLMGFIMGMMMGQMMQQMMQQGGMGAPGMGMPGIPGMDGGFGMPGGGGGGFGMPGGGGVMACPVAAAMECLTTVVAVATAAEAQSASATPQWLWAQLVRAIKPQSILLDGS
jgi:hypothetical protein